MHIMQYRDGQNQGYQGQKQDEMVIKCGASFIGFLFFHKKMDLRFHTVMSSFWRI